MATGAGAKEKIARSLVAVCLIVRAELFQEIAFLRPTSYAFIIAEGDHREEEAKEIVKEERHEEEDDHHA